MLPSKPGLYVSCRPSSAKAVLTAAIICRRRRPSKQDTKLVALSTVSTIHLVIITVKRTSVFDDRGGNYRCVSCSLDRPAVITAIIIADPKPELMWIADQSGTTSDNYLSVDDDGRNRTRSYRREPFDRRSTPRCILLARKIHLTFFSLQSHVRRLKFPILRWLGC